MTADLSTEQKQEFLSFAEELAAAAGAAALPYFRSGVSIIDKGAAAGEIFDPVTAADRAAEDAMRALIETRYPDHGILGEERGEKAGASPFRWVLDPIDGTRAFISGGASWTTLIALDVDEKPVLGAIAQPFIGEIWVGSGEETTYKRGEAAKRARTRGVKLSEAVLSTTDPRALANGGYFEEREAGAFAAVAEKARLARFSLDAYAYALLAAGEIDVVIETGLQAYDVHALAPVVRGAGGVFTGWRGEEVYEGRIVAAANAELHTQVLEVLAASI